MKKKVIKNAKSLHLKNVSDNHFKNLRYKIEESLTVQNNVLINSLSKLGLHLYVIVNEEYMHRFAYITPRYLYKDTYISGREINIFDISHLQNAVEFDICTDIFKDKFIRLAPGNGQYLISPKEYFFEKKYVDGKPKFFNKWKLSTKRIVLDKEMWFMETLNIIMSRKTSKFPLRKQFEQELFQNIELDKRIKKVVKSELMKLPNNEFQALNTHTIILTQGGTGKSSVCGRLGYNLDNSSNAGIYGYYNASNSKWNAGVVERTKKAILVDEINELINNSTSGDNVLSTLNKPLENGEYTYGKAGGKTVPISNMFIFLGNISGEFTYENFVTGIATNIETIGRRFSYIIYDDKAYFKKLRDSRISYSSNPFLEAYSEALSYMFRYYLEIEKFPDKYFNIKAISNIENEYKTKMKNLVRTLEVPNTRKFMYSWLGDGMKRLKTFALKLTIFDESDRLFSFGHMIKLNYNNIHPEYSKHNVYRNYEFIQEFINQYKALCEDMLTSTSNMVHHINNNPDAMKGAQEHSKSEYGGFSKQTRLSFELICTNLDLFKEQKLYYKDIPRGEKGELKFLVYNLKKQKTNLNSVNKQFNQLGITMYFDSNNRDYYFIITRKPVFDKFYEVYMSGKESVEAKVDMSRNKSKGEEKKHVLDEIDTFDLT